MELKTKQIVIIIIILISSLALGSYYYFAKKKLSSNEQGIKPIENMENNSNLLVNENNLKQEKEMMSTEVKSGKVILLDGNNLSVIDNDGKEKSFFITDAAVVYLMDGKDVVKKEIKDIVNKNITFEYDNKTNNIIAIKINK